MLEQKGQTGANGHPLSPCHGEAGKDGEREREKQNLPGGVEVRNHQVLQSGLRPFISWFLEGGPCQSQLHFLCFCEIHFFSYNHYSYFEYISIHCNLAKIPSSLPAERLAKLLHIFCCLSIHFVRLSGPLGALN